MSDRLTKVLLIMGWFALAGSGTAAAPSAVFMGVVKSSEPFVRSIGKNLYFHLDPDRTGTSGWSVRISSTADAGEDFIWMVTPPYRGDNGQILGPAYNRTSWGEGYYPRTLRFVTTAADGVKVRHDVEDGVLWPVASKGRDIEALEDLGKDVRLGTATVTIVGVEASTDAARGPAALEFLVELAFPEPRAEDEFSVDRSTTIRQMPLREKIFGLIFQEGVESPFSFVAGEGDVVRQMQFGDLDGDGEDEAVVVAWRPQDGTSGPSFRRVLKRDRAGVLHSLPIHDNGFRFQGKDYSQGCWGHHGLEIRANRLVQSFPVYNKDDAKCCPTGGERRLTYRWSGAAFELDGVEELAAKNGEKH